MAVVLGVLAAPSIALAQPSAPGVQSALSEPVSITGFNPSGAARTVMAGDKKSQTVFIPSFRVAFQVSGKVTASTRESYAFGTTRSGTRVTSNTVLSGIDQATMQAITDQAYADLKARLEAAGFTVLTDAQWGAAPSAGKLEWGKTSQPGAPVVVQGNLGATQASYVLFTPTGMRNWPETVMPANLGVARSLRRELGATMLVPRLVVNYAQMSSSGVGKGGLLSSGSSVSVQPLIHGGFYAGGFGFDNWKVRVGQHGGFIEFKPEAVLDAPGMFATVSESSGDAATRAGNTANAISWALAGTGTFSEVNYLDYQAIPSMYAKLSLVALAKQNAVTVNELSRAK
jgi:hypothetical protein